MVAQCPQCGTGLLLDETDFGEHHHLQVQCAKCQTEFIVRAPQDTPSPAGKPPVNQEITGITTVFAIKTRLPLGKKVALLVMEGPSKGTTHYITKSEVVIGRVEADIVVDDPEISSRHCALEIRGDTAVLTDLGSTNGTYLAGEPIQRCKLEHLSEFRIGETTMMFTVTAGE